MSDTLSAQPIPPITVTVIMATYNRAAYLAQSLESLLNQTRPPEEILVIDDGSTDDTSAILAGYGDRIRVIRRQNAGKPAALNYAIPLAKGTHIWLFDDDDLALPHALATHVAFLAQRPDVDLCFSRNYTFDGDGDIADEARWRKPATPDYDGETLLIHLMRDCTLVFQALLVAKHCFTEAGPFDETLGRAEDYDMLLRLARSYTSACTGDYTFVWRNHAGERGSASERHSNADRTKLFRYYERQIFARLRRELALPEYLSPEARKPWSEAKMARALLERADVMFLHDLNSEGASDLRRVLDQCNRRSDFQYWTLARRTALRAADIGDPIFIRGAGERARFLASAMDGLSRWQLAPSVYKGFYWAMRRSLRQRRPWDAARIIAAVPQFSWALACRRPVIS